MSDFDRDSQVDRLLKQAGGEVAGYLNPRGVSTVYETVRRRRRNRVVIVSALALAMLAGPAVGSALADSDRQAPPSGSEPSVTSPAESSGSPSGSPTDSPSATPAGQMAPPAPDGRISLAELKRAKLDLPPWPADAAVRCKGSDVEFVGKPVYVDVDHDGARETAALLQCFPYGETPVLKVMVFDRNANGAVVPLGQVLATSGKGRDGVDVKKVWTIQGTASGEIRIDVGEYYPCCEMAKDLPQHQWRTFSWDGRRFVQTGGPKTFPPNPKVTDLVLTSNDLVMTKQADGSWRGKLTLKARNAGPFPARAVLMMPDGPTADSGTWSGCTVIEGQCDLGVLASGANRTATFTLATKSPPSGVLDVFVFHASGDLGTYPDLNQDDNVVNAARRPA